MTSSKASDTSFLDGLRGLASLWVVVGHTFLLTGVRASVLSRPDFAVDLFILISGFLMTFHYQLRREVEPWDQPRTWFAFWVRRYFRIAPLYYVILAAAIILGPTMGEARHAIATIGAGSQTPPERYFDQSLSNILMHLSFLFGMSPTYHFRTALPDWSIGLEMQYYAAFPFLMLLIARSGWVSGSAAWVLFGGLGWFLVNRLGVQFDEPALLVLKLHIFIAGMLAAQSMREAGARRHLFAFAVCLLMALPLGGFPAQWAARFLLALVFLLLLHGQQLPGLPGRALKGARKVLGGRLGHFIGEMSYGLYLVHLLLLLPICAWLAIHFSNVLPVARAGLALAGTLLVAYPLAWLGHVLVEKPGIAAGKWALQARKRALTEPLPSGQVREQPDQGSGI